MISVLMLFGFDQKFKFSLKTKHSDHFVHPMFEYTHVHT